MGALFSTEMTKQWRRTRTYAAIGITILIPVIFAIAIKANPPSASGGDDAFTYLATHTGLFLPVAALRFMSRFLLVFLVALFAGDAVASEASWGNLRAMLTRPVGRSRLLVAKIESATLLALVVTFVTVIAALVAGGIAFGWGGLNVGGAFGRIAASVGFPGFHMSAWRIIGNLGIATGYVFWGLASVGAMAFMVSTMSDSPAAAVFAGFGLYAISQILDAITSLGSIRYGFPTHYYDAWTNLFTGPGPTGDMLRGTLLQIPYVLVFGGIGFWYFRRKDILS
ncbi:MAG TPA: ABC transporter permease [Acidimicrobiia bacterium]|nr:ABC transporter permease [Acidimicrobiia bacterium]